MLNLVVLVILVGMAACLLDKELHDKYMTMPRSEFVKYFNAQDFSWKMRDYGDDFYSKYRACAHFNHENFTELPLKTHGLEAIKDLPEFFDAREKWTKCESISDILDQDNCGSCWAFGTANTASDRTCIHKDIHVRLSVQDLECSTMSNVCAGGFPINAFAFWRKRGLVTEECKPYNIDELKKCECTKKCVDSSINYDVDKHYAEKYYSISDDIDQIKAELVQNGPIEAGFVVFEDFQSYHGGVYVHKSGEMVGGHSVRVIGYGVENGDHYWLVANSWGKTWGEGGLVKVKSYQEDLKFESELMSGLPKY